MTDGFPWLALATIFAVVIGPIIAVLTARYLEIQRANRERKLDIFRALMRTRGLRQHWEHVGALNLVEVEFINHSAVVDAWKAYLTNLENELPAMEHKERFDKAIKDRDMLLTKLIGEIAEVLGIRVTQLDILGGNYVPQGWNDAEMEQLLVRRGVLDVLFGRASVPVKLHETQPNNSPYPPPPGV